MRPEPGDGTLCSVEDCVTAAILSETRRMPQDGGLAVWIAWCGPHMIERRHLVDDLTPENRASRSEETE